MPWQSPSGFERPLGILGQTLFLAYRCDTVDLFGASTAFNVSFAIEAHSNASDRRNHFYAHEYSGFFAALAVYTDSPGLAEAFRSFGVAVKNGTVHVAGTTNLRLELADGGVDIEMTQAAATDNPSRLESDIMLLLLTDPVVGLKMMESGEARYLASTTVVASGSARLAEWMPYQRGVPSTKAMLPNSTLVLDVVSP